MIQIFLPFDSREAEGLSQPSNTELSPDDRCATIAKVEWKSLRKGPASLHIEYAGTFTNNLHGYSTRVRLQPSIELSLDLNPNLKSQNKSTNGYIDAKELADGEIERLALVQIADERIVKGLADALADVLADWIVTIELVGTHSFLMRPRLENGSLFLFIRSRA